MRLEAALALLALTAVARSARAADDGAYGRLDGDVAFEARAGAAFAAGGPALAAELGAVYLATAGIYTHYTDALGTDGADVDRSIAVGVTLRPLFWARYARGLETGPPRLDLLVDSVGLGVGVFWDARDGEGDDSPGIEVALGLAVPILEEASGPFLALRGALRWRAVDLEGRGEGSLVDRGALLSVTLGWHQLVGVHLVDLRDRRSSALRGSERAPRSASARW